MTYVQARAGTVYTSVERCGCNKKDLQALVVGRCGVYIVLLYI